MLLQPKNLAIAWDGAELAVLNHPGTRINNLCEIWDHRELVMQGIDSHLKASAVIGNQEVAVKAVKTTFKTSGADPAECGEFARTLKIASDMHLLDKSIHICMFGIDHANQMHAFSIKDGLFQQYHGDAHKPFAMGDWPLLIVALINLGIPASRAIGAGVMGQDKRFSVTAYSPGKVNGGLHPTFESADEDSEFRTKEYYNQMDCLNLITNLKSTMTLP